MNENNSESGSNEKHGWERDVLERLAFASLNEQRKTRRWGIFFKLFFAGYLLVLLLLSLSGTWGEKPMGGNYTALVDLDGVIEANGDASADMVISGLRAALSCAPTARVAVRCRPTTSTKRSSACVKFIPRPRYMR